MSKRFFLISFIALTSIVGFANCKADTTTEPILEQPAFKIKTPTLLPAQQKIMLESEIGSIFVDDFESYELDTNVIGQSNSYGTWSKDYGSTQLIKAAAAHTGDKGLDMENSSDAIFTASTSPASEGVVRFWLKAENENQGVQFDIYDSSDNWLGTDFCFGAASGDGGDCVAGQAAYWTPSGYTKFANVPINEWYSVYIVWGSGDIILRIDTSTTTSSTLFTGLTTTDRQKLRFVAQSGNAIYIDDISAESPVTASTINITAPESYSATATDFKLSGNYNAGSENWTAFLIYAQSWGTDDATITCPQTDEEWQTDYDAGYFRGTGFAQRFDFLATTSGTFDATITGVAEGTYNCWYCEFFNSTSTSENKCPNYGLYIVYLPARQPFPSSPFQTFAQYCIAKGQNCSSSFIGNLANTFENVFKITSGWYSTFYSVFDINGVMIVGAQMGNAIPYFRSQINSLNEIFGNGFPLAQLLIFILLFDVGIIVYKISVKIIGLIRGGG